MPAALPAAPAERFARLIDGLCRAVAARGGGRDRLAGKLVILIWSRLRSLASRFAALGARIAAGRQRRILSRRPPRPAPRRPAQRPLPHAPAWLLQFVPQASTSASHLRNLLADPEFAALVEAAPQMRRLLRPLCRMLGVALPPRPADPSPKALVTAPTPPPAGPPAPSTRPATPPPGFARARPPPLQPA